MSKGAHHRTLPDTKQGIIIKAGESITYNGQVIHRRVGYGRVLRASRSQAEA